MKLFRKVFAGMMVGVLAAGQAQAAVRLTESFDGLWQDPNWPARGWVVDVLSHEDGSKTLYMFGAVYDNEGRSKWVATSMKFGEFEFAKSGDLFSWSGGSFAGSEATTRAPFGTVAVDVMSCSEIKISMTPPANSGFQAVSRTLNPGQSLVTADKPGCAFKKKFTGCPAGTSAGAEPRSCILTGTIMRDLTLTNDTTWILEGLVTVGNDNANSATVTIEPGTLVTGSGDTADYLYINPGSKLIADGTPYAPIVFTSPRDGKLGQTPAPKDWGGIVLSGNAPNNKCANAPFSCFSEFNPALRYGGDKPHDSSGSLRYVQARYAGYVFAEGREVNSFTFQSVGDGTVLEHLQSYRGGDDGFEWFGGTVNGKYLVSYEGGDDGFDWDEGWSGKVQFAFSKWAPASLALGDDNGFESSNQADNHDAAPRAMPSWSNVTLIGNGTGGGNGLHLKEGTAGHLSNILVSNFNKAGKSCLFVDHAATVAQVGTPNLTLDAVWLDCASPFGDGSKGTPGSAKRLFDAGSGNKTGNPGLAGFVPAATSPLRTAGKLVTSDAFFAPAPYIGAFRDANDDWTLGWTHGIAR
jgi:hypothetical protein